MSALGRYHEGASPDANERCRMLPGEQRTAYGRFYKSARENKILDPKTTLLLHYASAMAFGCYP